MYVITVLFGLKPGTHERFMPLMLANARQSREKEKGCRQFDVCTDPQSADSVFLYEVYDDRAAFDDHLATEHFKSFDAEVAPMIANKQVRSFTLAT